VFLHEICIVPWWSTVREYETNDISEDEKKIRQTEGRAMRNMKSKSRSVPYKVPNQKPAEIYGNPAYSNQFQRQPFRAGGRIFFSSSLMSLVSYSRTVDHPAREVSAIRISLFRDLTFSIRSSVVLTDSV
jgi:hypothetical protein